MEWTHNPRWGQTMSEWSRAIISRKWCYYWYNLKSHEPLSLVLAFFFFRTLLCKHNLPSPASCYVCSLNRHLYKHMPLFLLLACLFYSRKVARNVLQQAIHAIQVLVIPFTSLLSWSCAPCKEVTEGVPGRKTPKILSSSRSLDRPHNGCLTSPPL